MRPLTPLAHPATLALAALLSAGCARTFVVASAAAAPRADVEAEVMETDALEAARPEMKAVAVRFPNDCWKFDRKGGADAAVVPSLTPACAPWGEALAFTLQKAGFRVLPHQELVMYEARQRAAPPAAAKALGVNALLVIDRIGAKTGPVDASRRARLDLQQADPDGSPRGPARLDADAQKALLEVVGDRVRPWGDQAVEAAVEIRVTAVLPGSGTPLWRYARAQAAAEAAPANFRILLRGSGGRWTPVLPEGVAPAGEPGPDPRRVAYLQSMGTNPFNVKEPKVPDAPPAVNLQPLVQELATEIATRLASGN
jgi:hypothetical protein